MTFDEAMKYLAGALPEAVSFCVGVEQWNLSHLDEISPPTYRVSISPRSSLSLQAEHRLLATAVGRAMDKYLGFAGQLPSQPLTTPAPNEVDSADEVFTAKHAPYVLGVMRWMEERDRVAFLKQLNAAYCNRCGETSHVGVCLLSPPAPSDAAPSEVEPGSRVDSADEWNVF